MPDGPPAPTALGASPKPGADGRVAAGSDDLAGAARAAVGGSRDRPTGPRPLTEGVAADAADLQLEA